MWFGSKGLIVTIALQDNEDIDNSRGACVHNIILKTSLVYGYKQCSGVPLQALLEAHDDIASKNYDAIPDVFPMFAPPPPQEMLNPKVSDAIRMVGIRKNADEPLVRL